jgi:hypothetical protein
VKRQAPIREAALIGRTPPPRGKEGTHPGRVSCVRNTETPTESGPSARRSGRPTVRRAEIFGGNRMPKKRMPVGESQQETRTGYDRSPRWSVLDNWPDTGSGTRASKGVPTWAGEPLNMTWSDPPVPKGKLDTSW